MSPGNAREIPATPGTGPRMLPTLCSAPRFTRDAQSRRARWIPAISRRLINRNNNRGGKKLKKVVFHHPTGRLIPFIRQLGTGQSLRTAASLPSALWAHTRCSERRFNYNQVPSDGQGIPAKAERERFNRAGKCKANFFFF